MTRMGSLFRAVFILLAFNGLPAIAQTANGAKPLCTSKSGAEYLAAQSYGDGLFLYTVIDQGFHVPEVFVAAECKTGKSIVFMSSGSEPLNAAVVSRIETAISPDMTFGVAHFYSRLTDSGYGYSIRNIYTFDDGCMCELGS